MALTFEVKYKAIDDAITALSALKKGANEFEKRPPQIQGGGKTVNEVEQIIKLYQNMNDHFVELIEYTISFLRKAKTDFTQHDLQAASKLKNTK